MSYDLIKEYYDKGLYTAKDLKIFVAAGYITIEQYLEITGEAYTV